MRYQRPAIIGASVLAFGAAVAVMLPPTKPIGGAKITSIDNQGFSPVKAAPPPEPAPTYSTLTPPMASRPAPQSDDASTNEAADADSDAPNATDMQTATMPAPAMIRPRAPAMRPAVRADPRYAYADEDGPEFSARDYKQGYRWAQRANVQSPRDCRFLAGAQVDGCHAYLQDSGPPPGYRRRDDDRRNEDEDDRPY